MRSKMIPMFKWSGIIGLPIKPLSFLLILMIPSIAQSQSAFLNLTLGDALNLAKEQNLPIKQADEDVFAAVANHHEAKTAFLPTLGASSTYTAYPDEDSGDGLIGRSQNGHQTGFNANWTLWQGGSRFANLSMQNASKELVGSERRNTTEQVLFRVIDAYLGLLEATRSLTVTQVSLELATGNREQTEALLTAGKATTSDLLRAQVSVSREQGALILARNTVDNAQRDLCDILNLAHKRIVPVEPEFASIDPNDIERIDTQAVDTPEMESAASRLLMSKAKTGLVKASFHPSIHLFGSYNWSGENYQFDESDYSGGLRVSCSLFEGGARYFQLQAAKADERSARFCLENTEREVVNAIDSDKRAIRNALAGWETAQRTVALAEESYEQIEAMYRLGLSTSLELFTAQETLSKSKLDEITAFYAIYRSYARLLADLGLLDATLAKGSLFRIVNG